VSIRRLCLFSLALFGCSDPPVVSAGQTGSASAVGSAAPAASSAAPAAASASSDASSSAPPKVDVQETEFSESERSRDPFRSFTAKLLDDAKPRGGAPQRRVLLDKYALDELKLIGIVTRAEPAKAMLVDPTGKGTIIQRGQLIGRPDVVQGAGQSGTTYEINWRVDRIRSSDVVLVREDPSNPDVPSATRVILLRPEEAEGSGEPGSAPKK
jgi:type IV pilus assembly protein PilP